MRLLFDQNLSFRLCRLLSDVFPNSEQAIRSGLDRADDAVLWEYARLNGFAIVTQDADFAELAALRGAPPKVIWLRCGNQPTSNIEYLLRQHAPVVRAFATDPIATCLEIY